MDGHKFFYSMVGLAEIANQMKIVLNPMTQSFLGLIRWSNNTFKREEET